MFVSHLRNLIRRVALAAVVLGGTTVAVAQVSGSDGTDGALVAAGNHVIDLRLALTGAWNTPIPAPDAGKGIYDPDLWVVVFKYTSIDIQSGAVVTFINHRSDAPVVWLAQGDVSIAGSVNLDGQTGQPYTQLPTFAEPGPGGFEGGRRSRYANAFASSAGLGPGGGQAGLRGSTGASYAGGAGHGGAGGQQNGGQAGGPAYSNSTIPILIGGSGGGASYISGDTNGGGGAGGGAILVASDTQIVFQSGRIEADGGGGGTNHGGGGSGGAIRLIAPVISGTGALRAVGGAATGSLTNDGSGGRIRVEAIDAADLSVSSSPSYVYSSAMRPPLSPLVQPSLRIVSVNGVAAPADPAGGIMTTDVQFSSLDGVDIVVEAANIPSNPSVQLELFVIPAHGQRSRAVYANPFTACGPVQCATLGGVVIPPGRCELQLRATWTP